MHKQMSLHDLTNRPQDIRSIVKVQLDKQSQAKYDTLKSRKAFVTGESYHQLYLKTYIACDGPKFVGYDY